MNELSSFEIHEVHTANDRFYQGSVDSCSLNRKLEYYCFQMTCHNDFTVNLKSDFDSTIYICVNLSAKGTLDLECRDHLMTIPPFASLLIPFKDACNFRFKGEDTKKYDYLLLKIDSSHLDDEQMQLVKSMQKRDLYLDISSSQNILIPNLAICEVARKLKAIDKKSCGNKFIASGYGNILIGLKLKEFTESNSLDPRLATLRNYEITQLESLTKEIMENPQKQYSINELCKQTGLSVSKLQSGFKMMHKCTVAIFIRNIRLEKALELLRNTDLNVSEIVYSIGLNSRSYFCRIFKDHYRCSPKTYQQQLKGTVLAVS